MLAKYEILDNNINIQAKARYTQTIITAVISNFCFTKINLRFWSINYRSFTKMLKHKILECHMITAQTFPSTHGCKIIITFYTICW